MKSDLSPSLVMETSKDNYQVLFVCDRLKEGYDDHREDEAAKRVLDVLKKQYNADLNVGLSQPFRMAGFNNKKQGRDGFIVKIHHYDRTGSAKVREMVDQTKSTIKKRKKRETKRVETPVQENFPVSAFEDFKKLWRKQRDLAFVKVNRGEWEDIDLSVIDFRVACEMLRRGYGSDVISACLFKSPKLTERHANVDDYVERTVKNAQNWISREVER